MARIIKISELPKAKKLSPKMKRLKEKLLNGPTMTSEQIKEYEKRFPWLKNYKD